MGKEINISGRLHSREIGNVVAGADEILDDNEKKKQSQINAELIGGQEQLEQDLQNGLGTKQDTITEVTASVDNTIGEPEVRTTFVGGKMNFAFKNIKGNQGVRGATGEKGPKGDSAVFDPTTGNIATIKQTTGGDTESPMSQKAVTDLFDGQYGDYGEDFAVSDEDNNVIVEFGDGEVKTKKFDSSKTPYTDDDKYSDFSLVDENGNTLLSIYGGHIYTKNFSSDNSLSQKTSDTVSDTFVIAASNSDAKSKRNADIICDGVNDSLLIENCIKSIQGTCGTLIFCAGTYKMTFRAETESNYAAILLPANNKQVNLIAQHSNGVTHTQVFFEVNQETYNSLEDEGIEYSIIKHTNCSNLIAHLNYHLDSHLKLQGIGFKVYDNQKPITCINCQYTGQICMEECRGIVTSRPYVGDGTLTIVPSINCVFFKGLSGSSHAYSNISRSSCIGYGIGWGVQGEHIYMQDCGAVNCLYGYAFNYFPKNYGMYVHPMILINCLEECGMNFPIFGANTQKQNILIYNWHIEHKKSFFDMQGGGHYATETTPGQWFGHIDYNIQYFPTSTRWHEVADETIPFWANGCGHSMESINIVHKKIVTTSERNSYAPNYGQVVFDSTLNKECICIDPDNKTWVDANGIEV